jgi:hypothetical protein
VEIIFGEFVMALEVLGKKKKLPATPNPLSVDKRVA